MGGTHATALPEQVLRECAAVDVVVRQEYDYTIGEIIHAGDQLDAVHGITYRKEGEIVSTPDREWLTDMDDFPFVSVTNFVDELQYIHDKMPYIKEIFIEDDTFTVDKKRTEAICDEIQRRGLHLIWSCNVRADLPYDLMQKMKSAGCRLLVVGYESGSQKVLDETQKGIRLEQSLEFAKNTKKLKLKVFGCFMIGLKGDDRSTIEETFQFAKKVYPDMCFFQQAVPFPGTGFYRWVKEKGYLRTEDYSQWLNQDGYLDCLVDYPYASHEEIEKLRDHLMSRYYFSFTYIVKTFLRNLSWQELKRVTRAGVTYLAFRIKSVRR